MRPLVPQPKFNPPLLLKLVLIYGLIMFLLVGAYVIEEFNWYLRDYQRGGMGSVMESLRIDFWGLDSEFIRGMRRCPPLVSFLPLGIGGIFGVMHYIMVRKRRTLAELIGQAEAEKS